MNKKLLDWIDENVFEPEYLMQSISVVSAKKLRDAIRSGELEPEVSGDVEEAIEYFSVDRDNLLKLIPNAYGKFKKDYKKALPFYVLAIQALRNYKSKPCSWCRLMPPLRSKCYKIDDDGDIISDDDVVTADYCPKCGRKVEKE